jgi:hypothetical protein
MKSVPILVSVAAALLIVANSAYPQSSENDREKVDQAVQDAETSIRDVPIDATLTLKGGTAAAGVGIIWGSGKVTYKGSVHAFTIKGLSVLDFGGSHIDATGIVLHLDKLSDFAGQYTSFAAGATVAGGASNAYLKNEHGVVIKVISKTEGLRFTLSSGQISVKFKG